MTIFSTRMGSEPFRRPPWGTAGQTKSFATLPFSTC